MFFSPTLYVSDIWHTSHSDCTLYFARTHCLVHSVCLHAHEGFFFHSSQEDTSIIMFKPHLYFECERMSTEKKLKLCRKKKTTTTNKLLYLCSIRKHTYSHCFLHAREQKQWTSMSLSWFHKTHSDFPALSQLSACHSCLLIQH